MRALKSPPGPPRKERVRAVRPAVRASRIDGAGIFRAFLLLTLLSLPAPVLAQTDPLVWFSDVAESADEGGTIAFTINREEHQGAGDALPVSVKVDVVPATPIEGFNIISGGDDTDGIELTVNMAAGETSATGSIGTINNSIVNDDVVLNLSIDSDSGTGYATQHTGPRPPTATSTVKNGTDEYVLGVRQRSPTPTVPEGATIILEFMRCVGVSFFAEVASCEDALVAPRAGAKSPALTLQANGRMSGDFFTGDPLRSVSFDAGSFSKTVEIATVNDLIDENDGSLAVRTFPATSPSVLYRYVLVAIEDDDTRGVTVSKSELDIDEGGSGTYTVVLDSEPTRGVTVSKSELDIDEGGSGTYTVVLDSEPTGSVTVTPSRIRGDADVTVSGALTFTTANWDMAQTVTVSAAQDLDAGDTTAVIGHTVSGGDYGSVPAASVAVTVDDDERPSTGVILSVSPRWVGEGAGATTVTVTATLNGGTRGAATPVGGTVGSGTAVSGTDFTAVAGFAISIPANAQSHTGTFTLTPTQDTVEEPTETVTVAGFSVAGLSVTGATVWILDDDSPLVWFSDVAESADEGGTIAFTINRAEHQGAGDAPPVSVKVDVVPATPIEGFNIISGGDDMDGIELTVNIAAGETSATGSIGTINNSIVNDDVVLNLSIDSDSGTGYATQDTGPWPPTATSTVRNGTDEYVLGVRQRSPTPTVPEGATIILEFMRCVGVSIFAEVASCEDALVAPRAGAKSPALTLRANWRMSGDFFTGDPLRSVSFDAGSFSRTVEIATVNDLIDENDGSLAVRTFPASSPTVLYRYVLVAIEDDDTRGVTVSKSELDIDEGGSGTYTVVLDSEPTGSVTVTPSRSSGSTDVTVSGALTFTTADWDTARTVTVSAAQDRDAIEDTAVIGHAVSGGDYGAVAVASVDVTVDDDELGVILTVSPESVSEGAGATTVTVTARLDGGLRSEATPVAVTVGSGTATSGTDFTAVTGFSISIPANTRWHTGTFTLTPTQDTVDEPDETVAVDGTTTVSGFAVTGTTVGITDDDTRGVTVSETGLGISEGDGGTYTVVLDSEPTASVTVTPSRSSGDADVTVSGALTFTTADWDTAQTVTVSVAQDLDAVDDTAVIGHAVSGGDYGTVAAASVAVTVDDDDKPSTGVIMSVSPRSVREGAGATTVRVTARLNGATRSAATPVAVTVGSGTATSGTDFTAVAGFVLSIPAGNSTATETFTLTPTPDTVDEPNESVTVTGVSVTGFSVRAATVEITDDDASPTVTLSLSDASIAEDGGVTTVTAGLSHASSVATTITVSARPVFPAGASDYNLSAHKVLTIAAGQTASTGTVTVTGVDNDVDAADRTVRVRGAAGNTVGASGPADVILTLEDDDASPTVTLSLSDASIAEDGGVTRVTASLSHTSGVLTTVTVSVSPDSPAVAGDYGISANQVLTIAAGQTASTGTVAVTGVDNGVIAADKTVKVQGTAVNTVGITGPADVTLTLEDDDTRGVTVSKSDLDIDEGADGTYTVVLTSQPTGQVTVTPSRTSGSTDVTVSGALTFRPTNWDTAQTVTVSAAHDRDGLDDDTAVIGHTVSGADYGGVVAASVDVTVDDDDTASTGVILAVSPRSVGEGAGATTVTVKARLNGATRSEATPVSVTVGSGTATSGTDFAAVEGFAVSIPAGSATTTGTFTLTPTRDAVEEPDETVAVGGTTTVAGFSVRGTTVGITDDRTPPPATLSLSDSSIAEDGGVTTVTASLSYAWRETTTVLVSVSVSGSLAVVGDYEISANQVLTIAAGQTASTGTVTVTGVDNDVDTEDKTVQVTGFALVGLRRTAAAPAALTLEDDDTRGMTVSKSDLDIDEGDDGAYTVVLNSKPTASVMVTPSRSSGDADVTVSGALTFRPTNWDTAQTVTVSAAQDLDAIDDTAVIGHAVSGGDYGTVAAASVAVTVDDDDTASTGVILTVSPRRVSEGAAATTVTVTARLNGGTRGAATPVTVTVGSGTATSGTDFTAVAGFSISIPANTRSHTGTFTLTPARDTVDEANETVTVGGTTTVAGLSVTGTTLEITDDDASPTVTLSLSDTSISEDGGATTVTASLSHASSVATTVTVSVSPDSPAVAGDYEISANQTLAIAAGQTASTGTVTVTGVDNDVVAADRTVRVQGAAGNTLGTSGPADVTLTLEEDDTRRVTVSKSDLDIDEGADGTYTVVLASKPTGQVTVTPSRTSGSTDVTISGALTFTPANWDTAQTVTVSAAQDPDAVDDTAVVGHAVSGGDYGAVAAASVDVTVDDDEPASTVVILTVSPKRVSEGASATTVTVTARLNGGTRGDATPVAVTVGSGTATSGTDFAAVAGFTISIPANTQSHTGTFTLTPTQDTVDEPNESVKVSGTTTVPGFTVRSKFLPITDDDAKPTVTLALSDTSIAEDGGVTTVTASLSHPSSVATRVRVSVWPVSPAKLSANKWLRIAAGRTASTGTVTVTGVDNDVDAADKTVRVQGSSSNSVGTVPPASVTLRLRDDDTRGVTVSKSDLDIDEGDDGSYTVVLTSQPTASVTVTPSRSSGDADVTVSGALTFTTANWDTAQTVTVSAAQDPDAVDDTAAIGHAVSGGDYGSVPAGSVAVTVDDDETASTGVILSVSPGSVSEGAAATTVTVTARLNSGTRGDATPVSVTVGSGTATSGTDFAAVTGFSISIPANTQSHTGSFTLTPARDTVDEPDETVAVGGTTTVPGFSVTGTTVGIADDDASPTVTLSLSDASIAEDGGATTVTASLSHASSVATTVTVSVSPDSPAVAGDYGISANQVLAIAAGRTASTGAVTVTGVNNDVDTADKTVKVQGAASNALGTSGPADVTLTLEDDDTRGVTVSKTVLDIDEGDDGTYTVVLASKPTGSVTVTPSRTSGSTDVTVSGALTFTTADWDSARTVTVSAAQDLDAVDDTAAIGHAVSGGDYGAVAAASVDVTVDDDETASTGVTLSVSPESLGEAAAATTVTVTARLNGGTRGAATPVSVTVGSGTATSGTDFAAVTGFTISIPANTQSHTGTFTLTPTRDTVDEADETVTVGGTTTVAGLSVTGTTVGIADDDASPTVTLSLSDASIAEDGGVATVTANLGHPSSVATTVTVSVSPDSPAVAGDYGISANQALTIAAGQTASTGAVTVTGVDNDVDTADKTVKVKGAASNALGASGPADVTLTLKDDDTRGVTVSKSDLDIDEGDDGTYTVVLASKPTGQVTVTPSRSSGDADVTVSGALTFTPADWDTARTVTVSAAQDLDAVDDTAAIGHAVSGGDYGSVAAASVDVTVDDDETASSGVTLSVSPKSVGEGAAATTVTVTASLNGGTRGEATPVSVTVGSGTATSGTDFAAVTGFSISIPANTQSHTGTFTLTPTQDTVDEPDETVTVGGTTTVSGFAVTGTTVGIADDDASPTVTLSLSDASIAEDGGVATVTAS